MHGACVPLKWQILGAHRRSAGVGDVIDVVVDVGDTRRCSAAGADAAMVVAHIA